MKRAKTSSNFLSVIFLDVLVYIKLFSFIFTEILSQHILNTFWILFFEKNYKKTLSYFYTPT